MVQPSMEEKSRPPETNKEHKPVNQQPKLRGKWPGSWTKTCIVSYIIRKAGEHSNIKSWRELGGSYQGENQDSKLYSQNPRNKRYSFSPFHRQYKSHNEPSISQYYIIKQCSMTNIINKMQLHANCFTLWW